MHIYYTLMITMSQNEPKKIWWDEAEKNSLDSLRPVSTDVYDRLVAFVARVGRFEVRASVKQTWETGLLCVGCQDAYGCHRL